MKDEKFRTVEEQQKLLIGLSTDTQTPFEDCQTILYQFISDITQICNGTRVYGTAGLKCPCKRRIQ